MIFVRDKSIWDSLAFYLMSTDGRAWDFQVYSLVRTSGIRGFCRPG